MDKKTNAGQPHISHPIDDVRRLVNHANHHVYRAQYQDSAYELKRAVDQLENAVRMIRKIQQDYPIANPALIDTSKPPTDPSLCPLPDDESETPS